MSARTPDSTVAALRRHGASPPSYEAAQEAAAQARLAPLLAGVDDALTVLDALAQREAEFLEGVQRVRWPNVQVEEAIRREAQEIWGHISPSAVDNTQRQLAGWGASLTSYRLWFGLEESEMMRRALAVVVLPPEMERRVRRLHRDVDRLLATMPPPTGHAAAPPGGSWRPLMREEIHGKEYRPAKPQPHPFDRGAA